MRISVIIPTQNRSQQLLHTLKSLSLQTTLSEVEIIVIDNGSTDDTAEVVHQFSASLTNLIYKYDPMPGLLTGRHLGLSIATGEILCYLDDDVELNPNYIAQLQKTFIDETIHFATGPCLPKFETKAPSWLKYFWDEVAEGKFCSWLSLLDFGSQRKIISPLFIFGLNFCSRKQTIIDLGGFHPDCIPQSLQHFQGDGETALTLKAIDRQLLAVYEPNLELKHLVPKHRLTMAYFEKRAFYQGVCNSFTQIRTEELEKKYLATPRVSKLKMLKNKLHPYYKWIKNVKIKQTPVAEIIPDAIKKMQNTLSQCERDGYNFHQNAYHQNEQVKNWVLKENYWDFKLPNL